MMLAPIHQLVSPVSEALSRGPWPAVRRSRGAPAPTSASAAESPERGVDLSQEFPKPLTDEFVSAADVVITLGCGDACPLYPGERDEDWEVDDPAGRSLATVRRIRDDSDGRVRRLVESLLPADARA